MLADEESDQSVPFSVDTVDDGEAALREALNLRSQKKYDGAQEILQRLVKLNLGTQAPEDCELKCLSVSGRAQYELGLLLADKGRLLEAVNNLQGSLELMRRCLPEERRMKQDEGTAGPMEIACATAEYKLAVLKRSTPDALPEVFVRSLFDGFAATFEHKLVDRLAYCAPEELCAAILSECAPLAETDAVPFATCLDLGAGTGCLGVLLREHCKLLVGVELSPEMAIRAQEKSVYDTMHVGDMHKFVEELAVNAEYDARPWDLVTACDVFVYLGCLKRIFASVQGLCSEGRHSLFAFTTEIMQAHTAQEMFSFRLIETGRYQHTPGYVRQVADQHSFKVLSCKSKVIRKNYGQDVWGHIWVLTSK